MDSKKTRFSADGVLTTSRATVMVARVRVTREALCGRYLTFAARDVLRGKRVIGLPAGADRQLIGAAPDRTVPDETGLQRTRRWKLRQR
jgi:hypothetical protein